MATVVVIGSFNTDLITYLPRLPVRGESVTGRQFLTGAGGKGSNQAIGAARLGASVTLLAAIGADDFGRAGIQLWEQAGIDTRHIVQSPVHHTGVATIFVEEGTGENMIAFAPGANQALLPQHVMAASEAIAQADILLAQLEVPLETVQCALEIARQHHVPTILNPAPAAALPAQILHLTDYLTPNETEAERLLGHRASAARMAAGLAERTGQHVIVTVGADGAVFVGEGRQGHTPGFIVSAVDTVGAGDAFNAGLAVALAEGQPLEMALRFACAVGALSVTRQGAAASMPTRTEVEALVTQTTD